MAAVAAMSSVSATCFVQRAASLKQTAAPRVQGLPSLRVSRVVCSAERKEKKIALAATTVAATAGSALPSLAAVENILGGEGTGLPLGLNATGLTWIIAGVFTAIWALYFVYSSSLPEGDDDSGLGL